MPEPGERTGQRVQHGVGFGCLAGGEEQESGVVSAELADQLGGLHEIAIPHFVLEQQARLGVKSAVAGNLDHVGLLAGDAGGEQVQRAAFLDHEVQAHVPGGRQNGSFLGFVVEIVGPARGGGHEDQAEAVGAGSGGLQGLADAANGAVDGVRAQGPMRIVGGEEFPGSVQKSPGLGRVLSARGEFDQQRRLGGVEQPDEELGGAVEPGEDFLAELEESGG